jgi:hypothetical protein
LEPVENAKADDEKANEDGTAVVALDGEPKPTPDNMELVGTTHGRAADELSSGNGNDI